MDKVQGEGPFPFTIRAEQTCDFHNLLLRFHIRLLQKTQTIKNLVTSFQKRKAYVVQLEP